MKKIVTLLLVVFTITSFSQESVLLRLNYKKGDSYLLKMDMKQDMGPVKMNMKMNMKTDVIDVKEKKIETENQFVKIVMDMEAQGEKMHYDSDMKEEDMSAYAKGTHAKMKELKESVITMFYDDLGNIIDAKTKSGSLLSIEAFKDNSSSFVLPKESVKVGSTWSYSKKTGQGVSMEYQYKITEIKKDEILLDVSGKVSELAQGTIKGKAVLSRYNNMLSSMNLDMDMSVMGMNTKSKVNMTIEKL